MPTIDELRSRSAATFTDLLAPRASTAAAPGRTFRWFDPDDAAEAVALSAQLAIVSGAAENVEEGLARALLRDALAGAAAAWTSPDVLLVSTAGLVEGSDPAALAVAAVGGAAFDTAVPAGPLQGGEGLVVVDELTTRLVESALSDGQTVTHLTHDRSPSSCGSATSRRDQPRSRCGCSSRPPTSPATAIPTPATWATRSPAPSQDRSRTPCWAFRQPPDGR